VRHIIAFLELTAIEVVAAWALYQAYKFVMEGS
jgi:hypothetical protein